MESKIRSEIRELDIELDEPDYDIPLATGKGMLNAQTLSVRYLNVAAPAAMEMWYIISVAVYGQIRSKVTGGLTARSSKVSYDEPEKNCPKELWDVAVKHAPGKIWTLTN